MAARREFVYFTEEKPSKVIKIRIAEGSNISFGQVLVNYEYEHDSVSKNGEIESENNNGQSSHKLPAIRANTAGVVEKLHVKEGDLIEKGYFIFIPSVKVQIFQVFLFQYPNSRVFELFSPDSDEGYVCGMWGRSQRSR